MAPCRTAPRSRPVTLTGRNSVSARIITLGATLQAFNVPDRKGKRADVTLGYDDLASMVAHPNYWGQTIGRYANRIAGGRISLDGQPDQLTLNDKGAPSPGGVTHRRWHPPGIAARPEPNAPGISADC